MKSQRERIYDAIEALRAVSPSPGNFGPEPSGITPEIADQLHALGTEIRNYGVRERANFRERERRAGRKFNRQEVLDDDAEDAMHTALDAIHRLRSCPVDEVEACRHAAHGALEQAGVAISDPEHRKDAGMTRELRPRTREMLAQRRGDAEERDRIAADGARFAGAAAEARAEAEAAKREALEAREALRVARESARNAALERVGPVLGEGMAILGLR